jgi:hypothetical protein
MDRNTKVIINDVIERFAMSLKTGHWQALVAAMGVKYPYTFAEKVEVVRGLIITRKEVSDMPIDTFFIQKCCDRCGRELTAERKMSFFTKETLCMDCSAEEDDIRQKIREQDGDPMADLKYEGIGMIPVIKHHD